MMYTVRFSATGKPASISPIVVGGAALRVVVRNRLAVRLDRRWHRFTLPYASSRRLSPRSPTTARWVEAVDPRRRVTSTSS